jgi:membrane protein
VPEPATPPEPAAAEEWPWRRVLVLAAVVLRRATANLMDHRASQLAAGVSYFALISLFPLALLAFSMFGVVLRDEELQRRVLDGLVEGVPVDAPIVEEALAALASGGLTIGTVALVGTIWTGSALAASLRNALNVAFDVTRRRPFVPGKLIDLTIAPALGLLLLASLALTAGWRFAQSEAVSVGILRDQSIVWEIGAVGITGLMSFIAFLFLYWLLPNAELRLRDLWPGALIAALGFEAVKFGFVFYLANFGSYDVVYGSLGGVITMLIWVYMSANIMLFGAEVSAEVPRVLEGRARHGEEGARDVGWRESAFLLLRGLVLGPAGEEPEPRRAGSPAERPEGEA